MPPTTALSNTDVTPLRVTFAAYDKPDNVGGPVTWVAQTLPALRAHGIEPSCLFLMHWGERGPALDALREAGVDCTAVAAPHFAQDRVRWILGQLRERPPDVFVPNLVVSAYHAGRWAREAGIPTVGILHSDDPFYRGLQDEFVDGPEPFRLSAVVGVSEVITDEVERRSAGVDVRRIPYGVPIPDARVRRDPDRLRIAYFGRFAEEQKRISDLTRAFCRAAEAVPGVEAVLYGDGPDREVVEAILATDGAGLPVRLGGRLEGDEVQARLLESDVVVLLSDYEGLPIALLEAMACGCVPVCLRIRSGIPEVVQDGETGLLVDDRGPSFVEAVQRLHTDQALWQRLSVAARTSMVGRFSTETCAAQWAAMLHDVHRSSGPTRPIRRLSRVRLPPVHPALQSADIRSTEPPFPVRAYRRLRREIGRIRRRWGSPSST